MLIEQSTTYASELKKLENPSFDKVREFAKNLLISQNRDHLSDNNNREFDNKRMMVELDSLDDNIKVKLDNSFAKINPDFLTLPEINIIDYGCGHAIGTMYYVDYIKRKGLSQRIKSVTLIEPSEIYLERAALHISMFCPGSLIVTINKTIDKLDANDIYCADDIPTLHILLNVFDLGFDINNFAQLINDQLIGYNQLVCVGSYSAALGRNMNLFSKLLNSSSGWQKVQKVQQVWFYASVFSVGYNTFVTQDEIKKGVSDEYGVLYSQDGKKLLKCLNEELTDYSIKKGTEMICDRAFENCSSWHKITIPNSVVAIGVNPFVFHRIFFSYLPSVEQLKKIIICKSSKYVVKKGFLIDKKRSILISAFSDYSRFHLAIPITVKRIGARAFKNCEFVSLTIPDSVTTIGSQAFMNVQYFDDFSDYYGIIIPNSVTKFGTNPFIECYSSIKTESSMMHEDFLIKNNCLLSYYGPTQSIKIPDIDIDNLSYDRIPKSPITIPDTVTFIGDYSFYGLSFQREINLPNSITSIGCSAFGECSFNVPFTIPNSVAYIHGIAFNDCVFNEPITIPKSVTALGKIVFSKCVFKSSIIFDDLATSTGIKTFSECTFHSTIKINNTSTHIGDECFNKCIIYNRNFVPNSVTTIGIRSFIDCEFEKGLTIPDSVLYIGNEAFKYCKSLTEINLPNSLKMIGNEAFYECSSLSQIEIPDSVEDIGTGAFCKCYSLSNILRLPKNITTIKDSTFELCSLLHQIELPKSILSIGRQAFLGCISLQQVINLDSVKTIDNSAFGLCQMFNQTNYLNVKIKKIIINNFRAFKKAEIEFNKDKDFSCIIGMNDSGKSTIFAALEWFFNPSRELDINDFALATYSVHDSDSISVEVQFSNALLPLSSKQNEFIYDKDYFGGNDYISIKKYMTFPKKQSTNSKKGFAIKTYPFVVEKDKVLFSSLSNDQLKKLYYQFFEKSDNLWQDFQELEDRSKIQKNKEEKFKLATQASVFKQNICNKLFDIFKNKYNIADDQWSDFDNDSFKSFHLEWFNSFKFHIFTVNTSLKYYLNRLFEMKFNDQVEDSKSLMSDELSDKLAIQNIGFKTEPIELFNDDSLIFQQTNLPINIPLNNRGEGFQFQLKNAIFKLFTGIQSSNNKCIFAFEEPETHLHPQAQLEMYKTIKALSNNPNYQVIITTHSPYIVKELANDNITPIIVKRDDDSKVSEIGNLEKRVLPYVSMNEMNYIAFEEPSVEYHQELFAFLQGGENTVDGVDGMFEQTYDWFQIDNKGKLVLKDGSLIKRKHSLPYCVRNQIDHPNEKNKQYENRDFIKHSIDIMRNAIIKNPDIFNDN